MVDHQISANQQNPVPVPSLPNPLVSVDNESFDDHTQLHWLAPFLL